MVSIIFYESQNEYHAEKKVTIFIGVTHQIEA